MMIIMARERPHRQGFCPFDNPSIPPFNMAKSLRAKAKKASRAVKRSDSFYAVEEAARTARLHEKLMSKLKPDAEEADEKIKVEDGATPSQDAVDAIVDEDDEGAFARNPQFATRG